MRKHKKAPDNIYFIFIIVISLLLSVVYSFQSFNSVYDNDVKTPGDSDTLVIRRQPHHDHVDFKVVINGNAVDFNQEKYDEVNPYAHLHLSNPNGGKLIHFEGMSNVTLGLFFESLGITFNATCFILDAGESFCNDSDKILRVSVNGKENYDFDLYWPNDIDRILVIYGNYTDEELQSNIESVTDEACIYSRKCPERIPSLPIPEEQLTF